MTEISKILPLLIPIIVIQLSLQITALVNLWRRKKVRFDNKLIWVFIIVIGSLIGTLVYFAARGDDE